MTTSMDKRRCVLVAEDNLAMLSVICFNLERAGLEVLAAQSGDAAWNLLRAREVDAVVTDFQMPGMTGGELCTRMRQEPALAEVPVVFLTAKELELNAELYCRELAVWKIMSKPFSPRDLVKTVLECLASPSPVA